LCFDKERKKWRAKGHLDGKRIYLGYFKKEEDAARAYDKWALENLGEQAVLNFDRITGQLHSDKGSTQSRVVEVASTKTRKLSIYKGVCFEKGRGSWRVMGHLGGKRIHIGYFKNEQDAAKAYDKWAFQNLGKGAVLNFDPRNGQPNLSITKMKRTTQTECGGGDDGEDVYCLDSELFGGELGQQFQFDQQLLHPLQYTQQPSKRRRQQTQQTQHSQHGVKDEDSVQQGGEGQTTTVRRRGVQNVEKKG
jgi:hypothetical protein